MAASPPDHPAPERPPPDYKAGWFDRKKNADLIFYAIVAVCVGLTAADLLYHKHVVFALEAFIGSYGLYGFVCCVGLVLAAKELRKIVMRGEDFYDDER